MGTSKAISPTDVFISYSRAVDSRLAPAIQRGLSRLAKKWYRIHALTVVRDQTDLSASSALSASIEAALSDARFFVLLASPAAAESKWVRKEIEYWQRAKGNDTFLIALTDGRIRWDDEAGDFDWNVTDALPRGLSGYFTTEPLWQDFTWSRDTTLLSLRHGVFRGAIATLAAPVHGRSKRELDNEDVKAHRTLVTIGVAAMIALMVLTAGAGIEHLAVNAQRNRAVANLEDTTALGTIAQAQAQLSDPDTGNDVFAYQLLLAGQTLADSPAAQGSLFDAELNAVYAHPNLLSVSEPAPHVAGGLTAVSADGMRAASDDAGRVELWNTQTDQPVGPALQPATDAGSTILALAFTPDARRVAAAYPTQIVVWDTESGKKLADIPEPESSSTAGIALSPDGDTVASDGADMRLWNVRTGKLIRAPIPVVGGAHVAFSPDGRRVAFDEIYSNVTDVYVLSLTPGNTDEIHFSVQKDIVDCMAFSPDGDRLALGTVNGSLQLWDPGTGKSVSPAMTGHTGAIEDVAFSPDGTRVATAGQDKTIREWDVATGTAIGYPLTGPDLPVDYVRFASDGKELISVSADGTVRDWDAMTGTGPTGSGNTRDPAEIAIDPQGTFAAEADGDDDGEDIRIWNFATGNLVTALPVPGGVASMSYAPDGGSLLIVTALGGNVLIWNGTTLSTVRFSSDLGPVTAAAFMPADLPFMPTGKEIAIATASGKLLLEDLDTGLDGKPGATIDAGCPARHIAVSKDGMHIAFSCPGDKLGVLDGHTKSFRVDTATSTVEAMAFSPDGDTLIIGTADGLVWRRDESNDTTTSVGVHRGAVTAVAFSPDGQWFASAGADGTVLIYPAESTRISARITAYSDPVSALAFTVDSGHLVAFGGSESAAQIWHIFPAPVAELCNRIPYNLSLSDWNKWVSSSIGYRIQCGDKPQQPAD